MMELPDSPNLLKKQVRFSENIEKIESQSTIEEVSDCFGSDSLAADCLPSDCLASDSDSIEFSAKLLAQPKQFGFLSLTKKNGSSRLESKNPTESRCSKRKAWAIRGVLAILSVALGYGLVYCVFFIADGREN